MTDNVNLKLAFYLSFNAPNSPGSSQRSPDPLAGFKVRERVMAKKGKEGGKRRKGKAREN